MDVEKYWIYLLLAAFYGLSRLLKKDPAKPESAPRQKPREVPSPRREQHPRRPAPTATVADSARREPPQPRQQPKAMTFEELMREIMEGKMPTQEPVVDYDDQVAEEVRDAEVVNYDTEVNAGKRSDSDAVAAYEQAKKDAFYRPSLEETMKVEDTVVSFGKFKEFDRTRKHHLAEQYVNSFRDMDEVRKAVVMSEILKPKF